MSDKEDIKQLLVEIRDNQRLSLARQEEHIELARHQIERAKTQLTESIELQRQAIQRAKGIARVAVPGIVLCIGLIAYLVIRYL